MNQEDLKTERLILRRFTVDDADDVQRMAGNINVAKMTLNIPHPYADGIAEEWIESHTDNYKAGTQLSCAITSNESGMLFGAISLVGIEQTQAEMGYWIGELYWGNGYCTEAGIRLIKYAFDQLGLSRVNARHLASNPASGQVMQKMGMKHFGSEQTPGRCGKPAYLECYAIEREQQTHVG